jgi:hypothetical protein
VRGEHRGEANTPNAPREEGLVRKRSRTAQLAVRTARPDEQSPKVLLPHLLANSACFIAIVIRKYLILRLFIDDLRPGLFNTRLA